MLGHLATTLATQAPTVLVLLVGLVLTVTAGRRLPRLPRLLALFGLGVLLVSSALTLAWVLLAPRLIDGTFGSSDGEDFGWIGYSDGEDFGWREFQLVNTAYSVVMAVAYPLGLGLVIAAVLAGRRATGPAAAPSGGWPPAGPAPTPGPAPTVAGQPAPGWPTAAPGHAPTQWDGLTRPDAPTGGAGQR
ncbi:hypothetical protein ACIBTZ_07085 [Micromonospora sp. NPDC049460]|uniref:hypothetical protein n=1 Tax=Micromonospora sp. NPDC049460 TaxID=3364272 RepID=UPI00378C8DB0